MTLASVIIQDAYRESNLIALGASPTSAEQTEGLRLLNRVIDSLFGSKAGEKLTDINYGSNNVNTTDSVIDYADWIDNNYVPPNQRLILNLEEAATIDLPPNPSDGARIGIMDASGNLATRNLILRGNGRKIEAASSVTLSTNSLARTWFYRADAGDWKRVATLSSSDESPFPTDFDDLLIIGLAMRLVGRNGPSLGAESISRYNEQLRDFKSRYNQKREVSAELGLLKLPTSRRKRASTTTNFDTGQTW